MNVAPTPPSASWTFLTNHTHVLLCLARQPQMRLRDVAQEVGITERAAQRIVADLRQAGYVRCTREGRRNVYALDTNKPLRHPLEQGCSIGDLLGLLAGSVEECS